MCTPSLPRVFQSILELTTSMVMTAVTRASDPLLLRFVCLSSKYRISQHRAQSTARTLSWHSINPIVCHLISTEDSPLGSHLVKPSRRLAWPSVRSPAGLKHPWSTRRNAVQEYSGDGMVVEVESLSISGALLHILQMNQTPQPFSLNAEKLSSRERSEDLTCTKRNVNMMPGYIGATFSSCRDLCHPVRNLPIPNCPVHG